MITKLNIPTVWGGHLAGVLLKNAASKAPQQTTAKFIGIHGWQDNLNSLLPLAEKLIDRHPNYEIYLYDRSGHGFSSHLSKGSDYSVGSNLYDLRVVTQTLGWTNEKYSFIGHSYGAYLAMTYAAAYPEEISCLVALDALLSGEQSSRPYWKTVAHRIDTILKHHSKPAKVHKGELTQEKATELVRNSRLGMDDHEAKLLVERSVRRDANNRLHLTRDESMRNFQLIPMHQSMADDAIRSIQASILFIGATKPQWPPSKNTIQLLQEHNPHFEMSSIDGSHHFHMSHVDEVCERIEQYLQKYLPS